MKNSFVMYNDWLDMISELDEKDRSDLLMAIMLYQNGEDIPELRTGARVAFAQIKRQFQKDNDKYEESKKRRAEAGRLGGLSKSSNAKQSLAMLSNAKQSLANQAVNVNGNVNVNSNKESKREKFTPPTLEEVQAYADEKGYAIDARRFVDFYGSKGWMVGKNKMKDWKAAVRNWARSDNSRQESTAKPKKNIVNDFDQRDIDYDELEAQLLRKSMGVE